MEKEEERSQNKENATHFKLDFDFLVIGLVNFMFVNILRSVDLWARNCVNPASSLPLAAGAVSHNFLPINLHISVQYHGTSVKGFEGSTSPIA